MRNAKALPSFGAWGLLIVFLFPIYWLISTSLKSANDIFAMPPKFIFSIDISGYSHVWSNGPLLKYMANSLIVCTVSVAIAMLFGSMAAYALERLPIKRKKDFAFWIITHRMAPPMVSIVPMFLLIKNIGLYDTKIALILLYLTFNIPFAVWMMRGYFSQVSVDLDEAALMEGCSRMKVLFHILLPNVKAGAISTAIMSFIFSWNEFLFAFLMTGNEAKTVPVGIAGFITQTGIRWNELTAAGTTILLPILVLSLLAGGQFIRGMLEGATKG